MSTTRCDPSTRIDAARSRWEAWWQDADDRAASYIIHPEADFSWGGTSRDWMAPAITRGWSDWQHELVLGQALEIVAATGDWQRVDEALELLAHYHRHTGHAGGGYPFYFPGFGAGFLAACVSGQSRFKDTTIWFDSGRQWSLEEIAALRWEDLDPWTGLCLEAMRRTVARIQPLCVIADPEVGLPLDVLSALYGNQELCIALLEEPAAVQAALDTLWTLHQRLLDACRALITPGNHGCATVAMRYLSARPCDLGSCDFSAMISPGLFTRFTLPHLRQQCTAAPGRVIFHLDGPGLLPHLPLLLAEPGIFAIQWVQGAGKPGSLDPCWYPLYRQIIDAGKKVHLCGADDPDALTALFRSFPRRQFVVPVVAADAAEAARWQALCED